MRRLVIPRGVKLSFNPENEFLFMIQAGHDMPAFSFIFIAVRRFVIDIACCQLLLLKMSGCVGYFFCIENFPFVLFVLVLLRALITSHIQISRITV